MRLLRRLSNVQKISTQTGIPTEELLDKNHSVYSRRDFIETTTKAGVVLGVASSMPFLTSCKFAENKTTNSDATSTGEKYSIAIIGGGIAGLHACHVLKKNGISSTVYEGTNRTGGRMLSGHNLLGSNLVTELGGEYIDTNHTNIFDLMKEFKLETLDTLPSLKDLKIDDIFIDGKHYTIQQAIVEFNKINKIIDADLEKIGDDYSVGSYADTLDKLSIDEYLQKINCKGWFKKFIQVAYESEFGFSSNELSALNLITYIDTDTSNNELKYFGDSDERYKVRGGNQQIVDKLAFTYKENILKEHVLTKIEKEDVKYRLTFTNTEEIIADYVIMAIPFTMLRKIEMKVDMTPEKKNAIQNLSYATNSKMMLGLNKRVWRDAGYGGYLFSNIVQNGWDNSLAQNDDKGYGGYTIFLGGEVGKNLNNSDFEKYQNALDQVYPGAKAEYNGKRAMMNWSENPFVLGSYACFTKGQIVNILPHIATPIDNIYFAGEHCSVDFQGFMEGGAETGKIAAEEILKKIKV